VAEYSLVRRLNSMAAGAVIAIVAVVLFAGGAGADDPSSDVDMHAAVAPALSEWGVVEPQRVSRSASGEVELAATTYRGSVEGICPRVAAVPVSGVGGSALGGCLGEELGNKVPRTWGFGSLTAGGESFTAFSGFADGAEVGSVVVTLVDGSRLTALVIDDSWSIIREGASEESGADLVSVDFLSLDGTLVETVDVQADLAAARAASPEGPSH
jgi:hypothetical protein